MGLLQVIRLAPSPTFYDADIKGDPPALSSIGAIAGWPDELAFATLRLAYKVFGGLARCDDLGRVLADHGPSTFISMTKLFDDEEIFGFEWQESTWIPMFQFDPEGLSVKPEPRRVRAELGKEFDDWTASAWFVEPNRWLAQRRPVDLLESDVVAVLHAARVDRFVAAG
jgi:hypothetical protein